MHTLSPVFVAKIPPPAYPSALLIRYVPYRIPRSLAHRRFPMLAPHVHVGCTWACLCDPDYLSRLRLTNRSIIRLYTLIPRWAF